MPSTDQTIVIVDDDHAVCDALGFALEIEGYKVRSYGSAEDALKDHAAADCYVVDYALPGMNGIDMIGELRAKRPSQPAIVIPGRTARSIHDQARRAGVRVIDKPFLDGLLVDAVKTALAWRPPLNIDRCEAGCERYRVLQ